ncbi:hypothetical protein ColKHC_03879 [Colletotrichum higginsianum]|nr:hypothetical protein ColKHC_03879 [Colletotrichum higginsianum]
MAGKKGDHTRRRRRAKATAPEDDEPGGNADNALFVPSSLQDDSASSNDRKGSRPNRHTLSPDEGDNDNRARLHQKKPAKKRRRSPVSDSNNYAATLRIRKGTGKTGRPAKRVKTSHLQPAALKSLKSRAKGI